MDQPAFLIGAAILVATGAATMMAREVARPWTLSAWAGAALLFAWIGLWTYQDSLAAGGVSADRAVVVGSVALGSLICALFLLGLAFKGSVWGARIARSIGRFVFGWFPWRVYITRKGVPPAAPTAGRESVVTQEQLTAWRQMFADIMKDVNRGGGSLWNLEQHPRFVELEPHLTAEERAAVYSEDTVMPGSTLKKPMWGIRQALLRLEAASAGRALSAPSLASRESFERLREVWEPTSQAVVFVLEKLETINHDIVRSKPAASQVTFLLLQPFLEGFRAKADELDDLIKQGGTVAANQSGSHLETIKLKLQQAGHDYRRAVHYWSLLNSEIWGTADSFCQASEYREFYGLHDRAVAELSRLASRSDLASIVEGHQFLNRNSLAAPKTPTMILPPATPRTTDQGLSWEVVSRQLRESDDRATAILHVTPLEELPQPLRLFITSEARLASPSVDYVSDPARPARRDAEVEIVDPGGDKTVEFRLRAPKLHPPAYLVIGLVSMGNAEIRVKSVRRDCGGADL